MLGFSYYLQLLGFFGGIHLAVLAAFVCQRHPNASLNVLIAIFFDTFLHWTWPMPVMLQDRSIPFKSPDLRLLMPIMMPCWPFEFCNSNITRSTFRRIMEEFQRGFNMTKVDLYFSMFKIMPYILLFPSNYLVVLLEMCLIASDQRHLEV